MISTTTRFIELIIELVLVIVMFCIVAYLPDVDVKIMLFATTVYIGSVVNHSCTEICKEIQDMADNKSEVLKGVEEVTE